MATQPPNFNSALGYYLAHEGGWSQNPSDKGGPTNYGIAWNYHSGTLSKYGVFNLQGLHDINYEQVSKFYKNEFWDRHGLGKLKDQRVATKALDFVAATGGEVDITALNNMTPEAAIRLMGQTQTEIYLKSAAKNPSQRQFLPGWLKRSASAPTSASYSAQDIFSKIKSHLRVYVDTSTLDIDRKEVRDKIDFDDKTLTASKRFFKHLDEVNTPMTQLAQLADNPANLAKMTNFILDIKEGLNPLDKNYYHHSKRSIGRMFHRS
jgi:hypothetical protein